MTPRGAALAFLLTTVSATPPATRAEHRDEPRDGLERAAATTLEVARAEQCSCPSHSHREDRHRDRLLWSLANFANLVRDGRYADAGPDRDRSYRGFTVSYDGRSVSGRDVRLLYRSADQVENDLYRVLMPRTRDLWDRQVCRLLRAMRSRTGSSSYGGYSSYGAPRGGYGRYRGAGGFGPPY